MDDARASEIIARLKAFKLNQAARKAEEKCPGPFEGVVEGVLEPSSLVLYCRIPDSGCRYMGGQVGVLGAKEKKYLCGKNAGND